MRTTAFLLLVLAAPAAHAQDLAKLFVDQGKTYFRSEKAVGLQPGAELAAFSDSSGAKGAGKVIVMEVLGQLARVTLDDEANRAQAKYVRVGASVAVQPTVAVAPPPPPAPPLAPAPVAPAPVAEAVPAGNGPPPPPPPLKAVLGREGAAITIRNDSDVELTGCELRFPDRRTAPADNVPARTKILVGYNKIRPAPDVGDEALLVRCAEGEAEFVYGQPAKPKALVGRAEGGRGGGIRLFNESDRDWTQCDLIKANGTHFFQGTLKARAGDSVRAGLFRPPSGPEIIVLTCAQGAVTQPVP